MATLTKLGSVLDGKISSALTVAIRTIAIFMRLLSTKIVANRFLGPSFSCGSLKSFKTSFEDLLESESNSSRSFGFNEKKATSDPEIRALQRRRRATNPSEELSLLSNICIVSAIISVVYLV